RILKQSEQTRAHVTCSSIWLCTMRRWQFGEHGLRFIQEKTNVTGALASHSPGNRPNLVGLGVTPSGTGFQPDRPLHDPSPPPVGSSLPSRSWPAQVFSTPVRISRPC